MLGDREEWFAEGAVDGVGQGPAEEGVVEEIHHVPQDIQEADDIAEGFET